MSEGRKTRRARLPGAVLMLALATSLADSFADGGDIRITGAWSRATPPGTGVGAAYFVVMNHGVTPDRLIGVETPRAGKAELHTTVSKGGTVSMRPLGPLDVVPGVPVRFEPGAKHVMLTGLVEPLTEGERFPLTLRFDELGAVTLEVEVRGVGAMGPGHGHRGAEDRRDRDAVHPASRGHSM